MLPDLAPQAEDPRALRAAFLYLANLEESTRRTSRSSLATLARLLAPGTSWTKIPWHALRYEHTSALRAVLVELYAPGTANRHLSALRGVLRESYRLGLVPRAEYEHATSIANVKATSLPAGRALPDEELEALERAAGPRDRLLLALLYAGGLRRAEAAAVTWGDVEPGEHGTTWIRVRRGKGRKERRVPVRGKAARAFEDARGAPEALVLAVRHPRSVAKLLERLVERAGIAGCAPHDLRRTCFTNALARGCDLSVVSRMAGHADPRTTARYDRRPDDAMEEVADALDS